MLEVTAKAVRLLPTMFPTGVGALGDLVPAFRNQNVARGQKQVK